MRYVLASGGNYNIWDWSASGGSEGYHIDLAEKLAARGHEVWSFTPTPWESEEIKQHNGVRWGSVNHLSQDLVNQLAGLWIIQRDPNIATKYVFGNRHLLGFAAHDFDYTTKGGILFGEDAWPRHFDFIFTESESHSDYFKEKYPEHAGKVVFAGAYPDLSKLPTIPKVERNPYRLTYSSHPFRGLLSLLKIFRRAHEEVPDLELHVFFGWESVELAIRAGLNVDNQNWHRRQIEDLMDHPKVHWGGRLPAVTDIWTEYAKSGIYCYPTTFLEVCCQTVMEAQIFGAIPIVSPRFAISDHAIYGCVRIDGNPDDNEMVRGRFVRSLVTLATDHKLQEEIRQPMMRDAREQFDFRKVVDAFETFGSSWNKAAAV